MLLLAHKASLSYRYPTIAYSVCSYAYNQRFAGDKSCLLLLAFAQHSALSVSCTTDCTSLATKCPLQTSLCSQPRVDFYQSMRSCQDGDESIPQFLYPSMFNTLLCYLHLLPYDSKQIQTAQFHPYCCKHRVWRIAPLLRLWCRLFQSDDLLL